MSVMLGRTALLRPQRPKEPVVPDGPAMMAGSAVGGTLARSEVLPPPLLLSSLLPANGNQPPA
eukprot:2862723-Prorocentrum_lima.AAC.1